MYINTCCGWESYTQLDICPECKEHCDWELIYEDQYIEDELKEDEQTENNIEQHQINKHDSN